MFTSQTINRDTEYKEEKAAATIKGVFLIIAFTIYRIHHTSKLPGLFPSVTYVIGSFLNLDTEEDLAYQYEGGQSTFVSPLAFGEESFGTANSP